MSKVTPVYRSGWIASELSLNIFSYKVMLIFQMLQRFARLQAADSTTIIHPETKVQGKHNSLTKNAILTATPEGCCSDTARYGRLPEISAAMSHVNDHAFRTSFSSKRPLKDFCLTMIEFSPQWQCRRACGEEQAKFIKATESLQSLLV